MWGTFCDGRQFEVSLIPFHHQFQTYSLPQNILDEALTEAGVHQAETSGSAAPEQNDDQQNNNATADNRKSTTETNNEDTQQQQHSSDQQTPASAEDSGTEGY